MNQCEELLKLLMEAVQQEGQKKEEPCANGGIPVGVSNRLSAHIPSVSG